VIKVINSHLAKQVQFPLLPIYSDVNKDLAPKDKDLVPKATDPHQA